MSYIYTKNGKSHGEEHGTSTWIMLGAEDQGHFVSRSPMWISWGNSMAPPDPTGEGLGLRVQESDSQALRPKL